MSKMNNPLFTSSLISGSWQRIPFFNGLSQMDHREILNGAELISTKLKQEIFHQGDPAEHFGFVVEGVFRLYRFDPAGQRVIMDFV